VMVALLLTLIAIWQRLREPRPGAAPAAQGWLVALPFSVYLGWISIATIANVSQMLYHAGFRGVIVPESIWAVGVLGLGLAIATVMVVRRRDVAYGAVIAWAYGGIAVKQAGTELLSAFAVAGAVYVLALMVIVIIRARPGTTPAVRRPA